jgi:hypothetical protein
MEDLRGHKSDIFGACTTPNCRFVHKLTAEPSNEVVNRIHTRVKAHVEEFVVDPNRENAKGRTGLAHLPSCLQINQP